MNYLLMLGYCQLSATMHYLLMLAPQCSTFTSSLPILLLQEVQQTYGNKGAERKLAMKAEFKSDSICLQLPSEETIL